MRLRWDRAAGEPPALAGVPGDGRARAREHSLRAGDAGMPCTAPCPCSCSCPGLGRLTARLVAAGSGLVCLPAPTGGRVACRVPRDEFAPVRSAREGVLAVERAPPGCCWEAAVPIVDHGASTAHSTQQPPGGVTSQYTPFLTLPSSCGRHAPRGGGRADGKPVPGVSGKSHIKWQLPPAGRLLRHGCSCTRRKKGYTHGVFVMMLDRTNSADTACTHRPLEVRTSAGRTLSACCAHRGCVSATFRTTSGACVAVFTHCKG